jgi:hypothetical protein
MPVMFGCEKCKKTSNGEFGSGGSYKLPAKWLYVIVDNRQLVFCNKECFDIWWGWKDHKLTVLE